MQSQRFLDTRQVASLLGLSPGTVQKWRQKGKLPYYKIAGSIIRYDRDDIERLVSESRCEAVGE